jgi:hypothetical protein
MQLVAVGFEMTKPRHGRAAALLASAWSAASAPVMAAASLRLTPAGQVKTAEVGEADENGDHGPPFSEYSPRLSVSLYRTRSSEEFDTAALAPSVIARTFCPVSPSDEIMD